MSQNRVAAFLTVLRESQLLEPVQVEELAQSPEAKASDLNGLAKIILQKGWLTRFQLTTVSQGKTKDLMLGPYRLLDRLGEGGMGQVFKAHHQPMNRTVALKVIRKEKLANPTAVQRFFREVQAAAKLVHPNIVVAFDANEVNGTHYFAMEYVDGLDLAKLVKQNGPLPVPVACDYIRQAALGLQHAHEQGMVHRDIKPHNLLVTQVSDHALSRSGNSSSSQAGQKAVVKILDMGLARLSSGGRGDQTLTQDGAVIGTPEYIPPEQALNARGADIRSDLYSLGGVFFFLLTGRPPFLGGTLTELLLRHQMEMAPDVQQLRAEVPDDVSAIVAQLLAKKPEERFQTPVDLIHALEPICQGGSNPFVLPQSKMESASDLGGLAGGSVDSPSGATVVQSTAMGRSKSRVRTPESAGRNKGLIAAIAGVALVLIGLIAYLVIPKGEANLAAVQVASPETQRTLPPPTRGELPMPAEPPAAADFTLKPIIGVVNIRYGNVNMMLVRVERHGPGGKPIQLRLEGLPSGITSEGVTIEPNEDSAKLKLVVPPDAVPGSKKVQVVASSGSLEFKEPFSLTVQASPVIVADPRAPLSPGELKRFIVTGSSLPRAARILAPDGRKALIVYNDGTFHEWDLDTGTETAFKNAGRFNYYARARAMSPDGKLVFIGRPDGMAVLLERATRQQIQQVSHPGDVNLVEMTPDGKLGVTSNNQAVRLWDLQTGNQIVQLDRAMEPLRLAALSADGRHVATVATREGLVSWDMTTGKRLRRANIGTLFPLELQYSPDGRLLFAGCSDGTVQILDSTSMDVVREITGHEAGIRGLAVTPDGKYLLTGCEGTRGPDSRQQFKDCTVRLWEVETGREVKRFEGHQRGLWVVAISPDGTRALSAGDDSTMRLWDLGVPAAVAVKPPPVEPPPPVQAKLPAPDAAKQAEALRLVKELYKADYAKTKPAERRALADKLLTIAAESKGDVVSQYVLRQEAADLAAAAGSGEGAVKAIDSLAEEFDVAKADLKIKALTVASKASVNTLDQKAIAEAALAAVDEATDADLYDLAQQLVALAETAARKGQALPLLTRITERRNGVRELQTESEASKAATVTLKNNPDDPEANLVLGRFRCLFKGDWKTGLPLLAKGSDAKLKDAADKDLKAAQGPSTEQVAAGDAWYDLAGVAPAAMKPVLQMRAHYWYSTVTSQLTGITRTRIDQRLAELQPIVDARPQRTTVRSKDTEEREQLVRLLLSSTWVHAGKSTYRFEANGSYLLEGSSTQGTYEFFSNNKKIALYRQRERNAIVVDVLGPPDKWKMAGQPFLPGQKLAPPDLGKALLSAAQSPTVWERGQKEQIVKLLIASKWIHSGSFVYRFEVNGTYVLEGYKRHGTYEFSSRAKRVVLFWETDPWAEIIEVSGTPNEWTMVGRPFIPMK